jgi:hypothetical protein
MKKLSGFTRLMQNTNRAIVAQDRNNVGLTLWQMKANPQKGAERAEMILKLIKFLVVLALLGAATVAGYALLFDLPVEKSEITQQVTPLGQ